MNDEEVIIDRRAGRHIEKEDAEGVAKEIEEKIKLSSPDVSVVSISNNRTQSNS